MSTSPKVRVRFAPSPTGYLHVGGARTALYNFLFAKHNGGDFILRVEDTDLERSTEESMRMQISDLTWLGIPWVEGPNPQTFEDMGPYGPYRQSRRKEIYMEHAQRLVSEGRAYYDFRTDAELDALKAAALAANPDKQYQVEAPAAVVAPDEARKRIAAGEKAAIRFRTREKRDYVLHDLVRGDVTFPSDMVGDFVCIRSNGMPVYNFCCVIDDAMMKMTHIFRAEEHLPNTLRQMMLYEAFGYEMPKFGHLSFILGPDRQKLSKRHGATSCNDYRLKGYLPEALNNFMLLSGWSSPTGGEIMSREQQIAEFSADRFISSPAVFDTVKLEWMNSQYLRALPHEELWKRVEPFLKEAGLNLPAASSAEWRDQALTIFKIKMNTLVDAVALMLPLDDSKFEIKPDAAEALAWPETRKVLETWKAQLAAVAGDRLTEAQFDAAQEAVKKEAGVKGKNLFMPIRVAVVGQPHGSELKMVVPLLSKSSLLKRADLAIAASKG
jgi:nondiscriminating glutamyl-tRNA synthetase